VTEAPWPRQHVPYGRNRKVTHPQGVGQTFALAARKPRGRHTMEQWRAAVTSFFTQIQFFAGRLRLLLRLTIS
jgi:hypothetical protein